MYNKRRVYPQSKPIEYSAGFGKERLPRKTWLQEEQAAPAPRYRDAYGMPILQDDPGQDQRYKDYSKRRGGKDPMGFAAEEAKRRFQPAVQPTQYKQPFPVPDKALPEPKKWVDKQPFPVPDEALPDQAEREPKKWVDTSSRSGGFEAWKKAGMPGFDPMGTYSQVTGTAKDGTEFGIRAQADAYDRWQAGDQGPEQGSPRGKMPMVRNPQELYAEEWANRNQPFNASSMAPGDASGKMPAYPGSTLKSPDGKVFNGDMMIDDGNYKPSGPIDKPKREKWIDTPRTQSDPTDQYRQQPAPEPAWKPAQTAEMFEQQRLDRKREEEESIQQSNNDMMMGFEGSADRYVFHEEALKKAGSPEAYQAHYQAMEKIGKPPGKEYKEARQNYRPMTDGSYSESYQTDPSTARYGVPARTSFTGNYQPSNRRS